MVEDADEIRRFANLHSVEYPYLDFLALDKLSSMDGGWTVVLYDEECRLRFGSSNVQYAPFARLTALSVDSKFRNLY